MILNIADNGLGRPAVPGGAEKPHGVLLKIFSQIFRLAGKGFFGVHHGGEEGEDVLFVFPLFRQCVQAAADGLAAVGEGIVIPLQACVLPLDAEGGELQQLGGTGEQRGQIVKFFQAMDHPQAGVLLKAADVLLCLRGAGGDGGGKTGHSVGVGAGRQVQQNPVQSVGVLGEKQEQNLISGEGGDKGILIGIQLFHQGFRGDVWPFLGDEDGKEIAALVSSQGSFPAVDGAFQPFAENVFSLPQAGELCQPGGADRLLDGLQIQRFHQVVLHLQADGLLCVFKFVEAGHDVVAGVRGDLFSQADGIQAGEPRHLDVHVGQLEMVLL